MTTALEQPQGVSHQLWTPGQELIVPPEAVTPLRFREHFTALVWPGRDDIITLEASLDALRQPDETPMAYAFFDIDDLLGPLSTTLRRVMYTEIQDVASKHVRQSYHDYGEDMFFSDRHVTDENKEQETRTKQALIRLVKNATGLIPDEHIDEISEYVAAWRRSRVYTVAVTSAIEGTELSAIDFLGKHFRQNCDGIVITNGHYQMADKGQAALDVMQFAGVTRGMPVVHIDDLIFNTSKVRSAIQCHPANVAVATFQPKFPSHFMYDPESIHADTPLGSFQQAHAFLEQHIGTMPIMPTIRQLKAAGNLALID